MDNDKLSNTSKLHVSEVQIGMSICELDCDWLDTPFLLQGFVVESINDINQLSKYCEHVWVDARTSEKPDSRANNKTLKTARKTSATIQQIADPKTLAIGRKIYQESHQTTKQIMQDIRFGQALDSKQAKETVKCCVDSIVKDPGTMLLLCKLREQDSYTSEHSLNVCVLAIAFGRALGFSDIELNHIGICGLLHDIGKMKVPLEVLNKPGKLDDLEWRIMQSHPVHGRDLLMQAKNIYHGAIDVAYSHHERVDGTGYPRQLESAGISQYAKIISICDAYDAITGNRVYQQAKSPTQALKLLYNNRDTQFDSHLVDAFMEMIGLFPPGTIVELKNGCAGIVISRNLKYQHLPKVLIARDEQKQACPERVVNLAHIEQQKLDKAYLIKRDLTDGSFDIEVRYFIEKGLAIAI